MHNILYLGQNLALKSIVGLEKLLDTCPDAHFMVLIGEGEKKGSSDESKTLKIYKRFFDDFKLILNYSSLEELCIAHNIPYLFADNPRKIEVNLTISLFSPDFLISNGWGWIIPTEFIELPKVKALNCHSSFLPAYKGPSVYLHVLMNFEKTTGLTVHALTPKIDEGAIYARTKVAIRKKETPTSLLYKLSVQSGEVIKEAMEAAIQNQIIKVKDEEGFYVKRLSIREYVINRTINRFRKLIFLPPKKYSVK